jgi:hypothetical protein
MSNPAVIYPRKAVEEAIKDAQSQVKRRKKTLYVGGIAFRICDTASYGSLGITDDKEMLESLGKVFAIVTKSGVERLL